MKTINLGGKERQIEASPYSIILHEREFGRDLVSDATKLINQAMQESGSLNATLFLSIVHTLEKTAQMKRQTNSIFPAFDAYLMEMPNLSLHKQDAYETVITEIEDKFFREDEEEQRSETGASESTEE